MTEKKKCLRCDNLVFDSQQKLHEYIYNCMGFCHRSCDPKLCKEAPRTQSEEIWKQGEETYEEHTKKIVKTLTDGLLESSDD